jgi:phosphopantothenoylcysteine decarboxylase/phosphopantothenate--cysteine ligase
MSLENKKILLGISGCIAAYKACYLVRLLKKAGADVRVVLTKSATWFVTKTTLETLSNNPVAVEMFSEEKFFSTHHITYAEWADLILLAPATGNLIGKIANGIADDLLTTIVMAKQSDVMIAPAMNTQMYLNPIVQENISKLRRLGYHFIEPGSGELACETVGIGRLAEPEDIFDVVKLHFSRIGPLVGKKVVVTAGPTVERIDPVRYISNFSSGKMGYAIAEVAAERGGNVTLISGPTSLKPPVGVNLISVESAAQMQTELKKAFKSCHALIMAAAVADFRPAKPSKKKISHPTPKSVELRSNPDILAEIGNTKKQSQVTVGFALEVGGGKKSALAKLKAKNLDIIVMNDPTLPGAEFGGDSNIATIFDRKGGEQKLEQMSKHELAGVILDNVESLLKGGRR